MSKKLNMYKKNNDRVRNSHNQYWEDENYFYFKIKNKRHIKNINETVYNFEVENDNSYVANHIIVHNCLESMASGVPTISTCVGGLQI
jgi:intein/homing endonuclease